VEAFVDVSQVQEWYAQAEAWVRANVLQLSNLLQILAIVFSAFVAWLLKRPGSRLVEQISHLHRLARHGTAIRQVALPLVFPVLWLIVLWLTSLGAVAGEVPGQIISSAVTLLTAWVVIRLAANFIATPFWQQTVTVTAWGAAALKIIGVLEPALGFLDSMAFNMGQLRLSVLGLLQAAVLLVVLMWGANALSRLLEHRVRGVPALSPSAKVLIGKTARIMLFVLAFLITLNSVGIDLTALAVFTGAIGLGLGFGLQKVVSNLISGIILLLDRSVKPGDVIAIGQTYGWINALGARYVSVITRDGIEHLIPNEHLISTPVENWSYTDRRVRQKLPIGVSYESDLRKAIELVLKAADEFERILKDPAPNCLVKGFGESQVDLELRVWIEDAEKGLSNFKSEVYLRIWDLFHEHGVVFPFPQRDLHIKSAVPYGVKHD
jgi:small-conductance mechanosensitive channel